MDALILLGLWCFGFEDILHHHLRIGSTSPWYLTFKTDATFILRVSSVFKRHYVIFVESYIICECYRVPLYMYNLLIFLEA